MKKRFLLLLNLFLLTAWQLSAQVAVSGTVSDSDGEPLIGVNVVETGTQNGTITDIDGKYTLTVSEGALLDFSVVGYETKSMKVGSERVIDVTLVEGVQLDEVVVTALGISREKKSLGYAVTEVEGEDFTEAREVNIANALSGKIAGVNVSNIASGPGGSSRVIIRGNSSLTGSNQPLYVVDGIPIDNRNLGSAGKWGGTDWGDGISSINPDDIKTMTVLKGNTAAALYGARASNGVILITTKSGKSQKGVGVEFSSNITMENIIDTYDFQTEYGSGNLGMRPGSQDEALEWGLIAWGERLDGAPTVQFDGVQRPYSLVEDNLQNFYRSGYTWTNSLGLTGGNEQSNFRIGITSLQNEGITPNSGLDRNTFTTKVNSNFFDNKLKATISGSFINEDIQNRPRLSDAPGNSNYVPWALPANIDVTNMAGPNGDGSREDGFELETDNSIFVTNPYWAAYRFNNNNTRNRLLGNFTLRYDFTEWLYLQGRLGIDTYTSRRRSLEAYGTAYTPQGAVNEEERRFTETNFDFLLGVDKTFGDIGINAFVGGNQMDQSFETLGGRGTQFAIPFLETVNNGSNQSVIYNVSDQAINSLYGSLELSYRNFLYLTATGRNDWFSTLSNIDKEDEDNNIFYPSVGMSFVFTDAFQMPTNVLSFGKIRASWAQVGGATDPYQLFQTYALVGQGHLGNPLGRIASGRIPNDNLVPLSNTEIEVGVDLRFFNNRLGVDLAYYDRTTENDILFATVSQASGFNTAAVNVGELRNSGIEALIYGTPIRNQNFSWEVSFNMAYNDSEVVSLLDPTNDDLAGTPDAENIRVDEARAGGFIHQLEGYSYSTIMGNTYARDDAGNIMLDDNGLPMVGPFGILGDGIHPFTGGLRNTFNYKNFSLSFLLDTKLGGDLYSGTNRTAYANGLHMNTLEGREDGMVTLPDGQTVSYSADNIQEYYGRVVGIAEEFVYDASFIKLRQFTLSYNLPSAALAKTPFSGLSFSLVGRNLALLYSEVDNIDPEATYSSGNAQGLEWFGVPQTRSFGLDVNVRF